MADLTYSQEENTNLIARLYALRTGLSVASNEAQCAMQLQNEINQLNECKQNEIIKVEYQVKGKQDDVNRCLNEIQSTNQNMSKSIENKQVLSRGYRRELFKRLWMVILPTILCVGFLVLYFLYTYSVFKYYAIASENVTLIAIIILLFNRDLRSYKKGLRTGDACIASGKAKIKKEEKRLSELKKILQQFQDEKQAKLNDIDVNYNSEIEEKQNQFKIYIIAGRIFCEYLDNQFHSLIDRRNWRFVDYIIFCLETKRAETLKECLRLADEEDRTQRLENAIQQASSNIQMTLNQKFRQLQNIISTEMNSLRKTIQSGFTSQAMSIQGLTKQVSDMNSSVNERLEQITSNQYVNNALTKNIAYNSYLIAKDCDYMAQYPIFI